MHTEAWINIFHAQKVSGVKASACERVRKKRTTRRAGGEVKGGRGEASGEEKEREKGGRGRERDVADWVPCWRVKREGAGGDLLDHFDDFVVFGPEGRVPAEHDVVDHPCSRVCVRERERERE